MPKLEKVKRRSKRFCYLALLIVLGVLFSITACGDSQPPEKKKVKATSKKKLKKKVKKESKDGKKADKEVVAYHYDPKGKKDPFQPVVEDKKKLTEAILERGPLTPLQKYSLHELKLVAIITGTENPKAMVEDPKGDGYIISKGTPIGDQYGEVSEIKKNEVVVVEKVLDPDLEKIIYKNVYLILHMPEEEEL